MFEKKYLKRIKKSGLKADAKGRYKRKDVEMALAGASSLLEADASELLDFAAAYSNLGNAIQDQLATISTLDEEDYEEVNPNAIEEASRALKGQNEEIDDILNSYEKWLAKED